MSDRQSEDAAVVQTILKIKEEVLKLREMAGHLPCVDRNCERLLSSVAMLELDVVDVWTLCPDQSRESA
ncbi:MAG TPA: hypothetical protein VMW83_11770 [Spirochaetia bacterium]|nr:hypothetical protein [Spirochaetia bacterium]